MSNIQIMKPCPFCGHSITSEDIYWFEGHATYGVMCPLCHAQLGGNRKGDFGSAGEALNEWNKREKVL